MGKKMTGVFGIILAIFLLVSPASSFADELKLDDVIKKIQANQSKVKDMYAETTTRIISNIKLPNSKGEQGPQTMVQKGKMWTKGEEKTKIEMLSPMRQTTITNGDQMAMVNLDTGQKVVQDLKKLRESSGMPQASKSMSLEKAREYFNLSMNKKGEDYVIVGVPKKENKFLGKMEFYVRELKSPEALSEGGWVPAKIFMYGPTDKLMSQSEIEYKDFSGVWVPVKNKSAVTTPAGKMEVEMVFENVRINKGVSDAEFKI
jgi:outer membrane lipoprotein-sorting protein